MPKSKKTAPATPAPPVPSPPADPVFIPPTNVWLLSELTDAEYNPREITDEEMAQLQASIEDFGLVEDIVVNAHPDRRGVVIGGHQRLKILRAKGVVSVPCKEVVLGLERERELNIRLNANGGRFSGWLLAEGGFAKADLESWGLRGDEMAAFDQASAEFRRATAGGEGNGAPAGPPESATLAERFLIPPFSVLDARGGPWQERKRAWLALGIESETGRAGGLLAMSETIRREQPLADKSGTSVFDPVLCEVAYLWFCPPGGSILDPFAGGSVRGIVASRLGRRYLGIELRPEQIEANRAQAAAICRPEDPRPEWRLGDARDVLALVGAERFDFLLTCPPYGDLEVYSDSPEDLSTMDWPQFRAEYRRALLGAVAALKPNRFACVVVGDFREHGRGGFYRGFPEVTSAVMEEGGARRYNELILVTSVGSLPIRVGKQFTAARKAGKTHQNVLVACKGDPAKAAKACGPVEVLNWASDDPDEPSGADAGLAEAPAAL